MARPVVDLLEASRRRRPRDGPRGPISIEFPALNLISNSSPENPWTSARRSPKLPLKRLIARRTASEEPRTLLCRSEDDSSSFPVRMALARRSHA
jgi:hypothetical protein